MSRLLDLYKKNIKTDLMTKLDLKNIHEVPKIRKIVLNMGIGEGKEDSKLIDKAAEDLTLISGQKAVKTKAKQAIAGFKIRAGMPLGASVTLRNKKMYEFLDRLVNIAEMENAEYTSLVDPFDRSVALVFELVKDADLAVRWMAKRAKTGAFEAETLGARTLPHARMDSPSAHPPYGIREGDPRIGSPRVGAALALCHGRIDVNIGVAVRSAEAAGFSEVFVVGGRPLMRTAMRGTDRVMNVQQVPDGAALVTLARTKGYQLVAVQQAPSSEVYHRADYPPKPLFMMGAEDLGLPDSLRLAADLAIEIPMFGEIDSLNVATAATTVMFHWRIHHAPSL